MLEDEFADFVKVSYHELSTHAARRALYLHPLSPGVALGKPGEAVDGGSSVGEVGLGG